MSFQDIEAGRLASPRAAGQGSRGGQPQTAESAAFAQLQSSLGLQVFKINANVQGILKLVDMLGTARDSATMRKSLHDLTETTRAMTKRGSDDIKQLAALQQSVPGSKTAVQKIAHEFQLSFVAFQRAQQLSAERQRIVVKGTKIAVEESEQQSSTHPEEGPTSPARQQAQALQQQLSPHELAYQESVIHEREDEIREIEAGIHELSEIFRDLGTLVNEQGEMIDNIESNISSIAVDTGAAADELTTAHDYQRKAAKRAACLMIVLVVVVAIVLLAILS